MNTLRTRSPRALRALVGLLCTLALFQSCRAEAPAFVLLDGGAKTLTELRGRFVVVNYWAEWCAPCRQEIPELNGLAAARAADVTVYGYNFDGLPAPELRPLGVKMGIRFPLLTQDPGPALGVQTPEVLPTTVIVDPQGKVTTLVGPQTRATLERVLAPAAPRG